MKKIAFISILILITVSLFSQERNWIELFNGKNLKGWERLDGTAEYYVENGEIVGVSKLGAAKTFLATKKIYADFILEYDMKMDPILNSGVQFRSSSHQPDGTARVNGYQVECDEHLDRVWIGGIYEEGGREWLYPMSYNPKATIVFKRGDWNHFRVEAVGNTIRTYVNGVPFANLVDDKRSEGFIGLQIHEIGKSAEKAGKEIRWKNIRVLTDDPASFMMKPENPAPQVSYLDNQLTEEQVKMGWKLLWDGKTGEGWIGGNLDHFPEKGWIIDDGELKVVTGGGGESEFGDLATVDQYGNFILELDFKLTKGANSGIKYFVDLETNRGEGTEIGCEYQLLDDAVHPDAKMGVEGNRSLGSLYDLIPANALYYGQDNKVKRVNGPGKWNRARIEVRGNKVSHYLNGVKVVEYERGTQMWDALVAYSKYKDWPDFGNAKKGHIVLQEHGFNVSFRNIKILEL